MMEIICTHTGPITVNTYILHDGKNAAIIDPGGNEKRLLNYFRDNKLTLKSIILTHGHFDHCGAVSPLKNATDARIYISATDAEMLHDNTKSMAAHFGFEYPPCYADVLLHQDDIIELDFAALRVIETPGHTRGSLCFECGDTLFSGDTLFYDSVGRSDFPGGDYDTLMASIKDKLFALHGDRRVLPGHGPETTLLREKEENPLLGYGWNR